MFFPKPTSLFAAQIFPLYEVLNYLSKAKRVSVKNGSISGSQRVRKTSQAVLKKIRIIVVISPPNVSSFYTFLNVGHKT